MQRGVVHLLHGSTYEKINDLFTINFTYMPHIISLSATSLNSAYTLRNKMWIVVAGWGKIGGTPRLDPRILNEYSTVCSIYKENFCFSVPLPPSTQWSNVTWHAVQTDFKNTNQAVISRKSRVLKLGYKKVCDINANLILYIIIVLGGMISGSLAPTNRNRLISGKTVWHECWRLI